MSKTPRANPVAARSRSALLDAAKTLLEARPAPEISIKELVDAAGMSRPTFYQHFSDLGSLFAAVGLTRLEETFALVEDSRAGEAEPTTPEALTVLFTELIARMNEHALFYARIHESQGGSAFHAAVVDATVEWLRQKPLLEHWAGAEPEAWEFLAAGVVWSVTRYLAAACRAPETTPSPVPDLVRILTSIAGAEPVHG